MSLLTPTVYKMVEHLLKLTYLKLVFPLYTQVKHKTRGNNGLKKVGKTNIFYPLLRTRTCVYQGIRNVIFQKILNDP